VGVLWGGEVLGILKLVTDIQRVQHLFKPTCLMKQISYLQNESIMKQPGKYNTAAHFTSTQNLPCF
jgi:hypothetical protein